MSEWTVVDWFTVVGTILTLSGLGVAIMQLRKTVKAAKAAQRAAEAARSGLRANVILTDLGRCVATIDELHSLVQANRYDAAIVRAHDLNKHLIQLREVFKEHGREFDFRPLITDAAVVRELIQRKVNDGRSRFDQLEVLKTLAGWSDQLTGLIGRATYGEPKEPT